MAVVIDRSALVRYSPLQMYALVNDVTRYSEFLDGVASTRVFEQSESHMLAELVLSKLGVRVILVTRNTLVTGEVIKLQLEKGPFKNLIGEWHFRPLGDSGCKVSLHLVFEPENKLLGKAVGTVMSQVGGQLVSSFCQRADQIYG
ncbi:type II toxin-antitoxin system RatA family toxin [Gynuella sunshinyii]|uniref:Oligoketide cyclase/lipid transport protein n=1 Tax=Gynuella sunshinyii YC6258 TaxID=1445510 RepID=A0A0C5VDP1_9GAMM|nr:type II toxin-antitoxin system RatA family toxin [Gynuella sunshinyii]AJQ97445.1 oligoketide cyclase/lipid transport protein [Gynuella sunshinyii YC6258]